MINGSDIWFVGKYTGGYANAAGFTNQSTEGLPQLTYKVQEEKPEREGLDFIDVSAWQGSAIDWVRVKAAGYQGVIIRAGHVGKSFGGIQPYNHDPHHERWAHEARAAGLLVGHYWYCHQSLCPVAEAKAFLAADVRDGEPLFVDAEERDLTESWVKTFKQTIFDIVGATAIYDDYTANLKSKTWVTGDVWQAHYSVGEGNFEQVRDLNVIMHQFSSTGSVPSITGYVDLNRFYGTAEDWRYLGRWEKGDSVCDAPKTTPEQKPGSDSDLDSELEYEQAPEDGLKPDAETGTEKQRKSWLKLLLEIIRRLFSRKLTADR
jgi:GH25 family lysozyme M1 (1,4-beta-N-acetylmuramidase)